MENRELVIAKNGQRAYSVWDRQQNVQVYHEHIARVAEYVLLDPKNDLKNYSELQS